MILTTMYLFSKYFNNMVPDDDDKLRTINTGLEWIL